MTKKDNSLLGNILKGAIDLTGEVIKTTYDAATSKTAQKIYKETANLTKDAVVGAAGLTKDAVVGTADLLNPSIEKYFYHGPFPRFLAEKNPFPRSLGALDMGRQSKSLDTYVKFLSEREDYKVYWKAKSKLLSPDFISKLASKNITFNDYCIKKFF